MATTHAKLRPSPAALFLSPPPPSAARPTHRRFLSPPIPLGSLSTPPPVPLNSKTPVLATWQTMTWQLKPTEPKTAPVGPPLAAAAWLLTAAAVTWLVLCGPATAAEAADSIRASGAGLKAAAALRRFGWPDEAVVAALAMLPVIELRGAIPVGYWMQLHPVKLTVLAVLGNMVPVPIIVLYLKSLAEAIGTRSAAAGRLVNGLLERARAKAAPVEEFQWLGLMLFVAVPFPGTGAWTGAMIAAVLGMEFWAAVSANFVGVSVAALLVNLIVNLGLKLAVAAGILLFFLSTIMWGLLRRLRRN